MYPHTALLSGRHILQQHRQAPTCILWPQAKLRHLRVCHHAMCLLVKVTQGAGDLQAHAAHLQGRT